MIDFLDHLLAQVRPGAAAGLEPRPRSRFEPVAIAPDDGSEPAALPRSAVAATVAAPAAELPPPRRPRPARVERTAVPEPAAERAPAAAVERRRAPVEAEPPEPPGRPRPLEPRADRPAPAGPAEPQPEVRPAADLRPIEVRVQIPGEVAAPEPGKIVNERVIHETVREIVHAGPSAEPAPPVPAGTSAPRARPPVAAAVPVQPQLPPAMAEPALPPPPAPIVEVRIGRIEIHAPQPAAPAAEAAPPPAAAGASRLDRFLARR